ncbi:ABC transporter permease [Leuconostoc carnosum]|uniref:Oligopeptide ABC transporter permease n=2 Tax=Leuconostoc carnosum TaxID=1252 RepID=K0D859_LEUCJ|nr:MULTISPECIES: ABC transporter permease [Leuconostoc]AFT81008.1 oligopeptide ABC transporter permease [Leuconostoc carnosum JB16]KAA8327231.1 ABC transporter permease [Leuconostoc carnosum]KAA8332373.1 ABC transporter permease [Leuconostoc carnosum]KAA8364320.1 ABC transporter permease [Leuconostoc carnosum]KAA8367213.1 ABC transporter permease [Leuconostoc carnosum]
MAANTQDFVIVGAQDSEANEHIAKPALSFWQDAWRRLKLNKLAVISLWFLAFILAFAFVSNFVMPQQQANSFNSDKVGVYKNLPPKSGLPIPGWSGQIKAPGDTTSTDVYASQNVPKSEKFILGTDNIGRSLAKRVTVGLRISLLVALVATFIDLLVGVAYGVLSGWKGGWVDNVMQRIIEILSSVPNLIIVTMLGLVLGGGVLSIILAIAMTGWLGMARQVRNMTLTLKERDYVLAAKSLGESSFKIAIKHLIPNMAGTIIVQIMMTVPTAIMFEAVLSAINLGVKPPTASLGSLISDASSMLQFYPYQVLIPSAMLVLVSLAFILLGDGLRDAFDPRASED